LIAKPKCGDLKNGDVESEQKSSVTSVVKKDIYPAAVQRSSLLTPFTKNQAVRKHWKRRI